MKFPKYLILFVCSVLLLNMQCDDDDEQIITSCDTTTIIDNNLYQNAQSDYYTVVNTEINGDCLIVEVSASGCDGSSWVLELIDANEVLESSPSQRNLKFVLANNEACLAVFTKQQSFDLSSLRIIGEDEIILNIEGFSEPILYSY